jgi:hypothetical protein
MTHPISYSINLIKGLAFKFYKCIGMKRYVFKFYRHMGMKEYYFSFKY